jgi:hypothetical protein
LIGAFGLSFYILRKYYPQGLLLIFSYFRPIMYLAFCNTKSRLCQKKSSININIDLIDLSKLMSLFATKKFVFAIFFIFFFFGNMQLCKSQETNGIEQYDTLLIKIHSPQKASLYSAVLPGLGQYYNKKYWKIPLLYAGAAALIYSLTYANTGYTNYKKYLIMLDGNDPNDIKYVEQQLFNGQEITNMESVKKGLLSGIDFYRRNRDLSAIGIGFLYLANIIDATVDAYLFDYDVTQDLSLKVKPTVIYSPYSQDIGLTCSLRF